MKRNHAITAAMTIAFVLGVYLMPMPANADSHQRPPQPRTCNQLALAYVQQHPPATVEHWRTVRAACLAHDHAIHCARPLPLLAPRGVTVKHAHATDAQRRNITTVLRVGESRNAPRLVLQSAVMAMTQESTAVNLAGGDGSSVGLFQMDSAKGSQSQRHTPTYAAHWYFRLAIAHHRQRPGIRPGQLAQAIERSGYPRAYDQWASEAKRTVALAYGDRMGCLAA